MLYQIEDDSVRAVSSVFICLPASCLGYIQSDSFVGDRERQRRALSQDVLWPSLQAVIALLRPFFLGCLLGSFWSLECARASMCRFGSGSQYVSNFLSKKKRWKQLDHRWKGASFCLPAKVGVTLPSALRCACSLLCILLFWSTLGAVSKSSMSACCPVHWGLPDYFCPLLSVVCLSKS